jgi:hypothetical protein
MAMDTIKVTAGPRLKLAMILAVAADILQMAVFPYFIEGAVSPVDDILDLSVAGILTYLVGWHWEFMPSFLAKLVPGVDMVPSWTIAVANVYRKQRQIAATLEPVPEVEPTTRNG